MPDYHFELHADFQPSGDQPQAIRRLVDGLGDAPTVRRRRVTTRPVPFRPDLLVVVDGLREGERIAVSRVRELRDGLPVRVRGSDS